MQAATIQSGGSSREVHGFLTLYWPWLALMQAGHINHDPTRDFVFLALLSSSRGGNPGKLSGYAGFRPWLLSARPRRWKTPKRAWKPQGRKQAQPEQLILVSCRAQGLLQAP